MSTRPFQAPKLVIPSPLASPVNTGDMSANIVSAPTIIQMLSLVAYSVSWVGSGGLGGAFSIEVSNDFALNPDGSIKNVGTWNTLYFSYQGQVVSSVAITEDTGNGLFDVDLTGAYASRLRYTADGGTGALQAIICGKVS